MGINKNKIEIHILSTQGFKSADHKPMDDVTTALCTFEHNTSQALVT